MIGSDPGAIGLAWAEGSLIEWGKLALTIMQGESGIEKGVRRDCREGPWRNNPIAVRGREIPVACALPKYE